MILTTNPGNKGHDYIKRIFVNFRYTENEDPASYAFIQAYAWDNVEWSRRELAKDGLTEFDYYAWTDEERKQFFITRTDYGRKLNALPDKRRRALLYGDWDSFEGQYFTNFIIEEREVPAFKMASLIQPWWPRWCSQDWGYAHHSSIHWHAKGLVSPEQAKRCLDRDWDKAREVVLTYRERVVAGMGESQLGEMIVEASAGEKISRFFLSPDAFAKRTSANTIAHEIGVKLREGGLPSPEPADNDRIGGARLMHELIEADEWFISSDCPEALSAIPVLKHDELKKEDVEKTEEVSDDVYDELRYGLKTMLGPGRKPFMVTLAEAVAAAPNANVAAMIDMKLRAERKAKTQRYGRQY
jgi:phage terminase large subunit